VKFVQCETQEGHRTVLGEDSERASKGNDRVRAGIRGRPGPAVDAGHATPMAKGKGKNKPREVVTSNSVT